MAEVFVPGIFTTIEFLFHLRRTLVLHNIIGNMHRLNKILACINETY